MREMPLLTRNFLFIFILVYLVAGLVSLAQLLRYNYKTINLNTELEKKLLQGELELKEKELYYLKEQIHPHFLFNTLNTIYGAALKGSKDTPDLILKLSNLLDYTLNQIKKKTVPISEEVQYIESYIGLEQVRFSDTLNVSFTKNILSDIQVPPMLFIAFIENAFKHGSPHEGYFKVDIAITSEPTGVNFLIKNSYNETFNTGNNHGLGIENSRKRIQALYPDNHVISIRQEKGWFYVALNITTQ